jgi:hypothetical protein
VAEWFKAAVLKIRACNSEKARISEISVENQSAELRNRRIPARIAKQKPYQLAFTDHAACQKGRT